MNGREHDTGGRIIRGLVVVVIGLIIWYLPVPAGVKKEAWHLLAIFVATIVGLILTPLPMGAIVIIGVMDTIEIWDKARWEAKVASAPSPEELSAKLGELGI